MSAFLKLFPDTNFNTEFPDTSGKFRTCGNSDFRHYHNCLFWSIQ